VTDPGRQAVLEHARAIAVASGRHVVDLPDVLIGLVEAEPLIVEELLRRGLDVPGLRGLISPLPASPHRTHQPSAASPGEIRISHGATELVRAFDAPSVADEVVRVMRAHGLSEYVGQETPSGRDAAGSVLDSTHGATTRERPAPRFTLDLTALGEDGAIDPVIGRQPEIDRLGRVLHRRRKPNPLLVGAPGVGKTAIVEGLALQIATGKVSPRLKSMRILAVDFASMISGTRYRGEFEGRLQGLVDEVVSDPMRPVLFIDEAQVIVGTGRAEGGMDASSILLPALARGELRVIGATTPAEYEAYFAADTALARRFEPVFVAEPDPAAALQIIAGLRGIYEEHHDVTVTDEALSAAVTISVQGAPHRHLPDKAIDLLDEACAMLSNAQTGFDRPSVSAADIRAVAIERSWTGAGTSEEVRDDC
jgi:ATP-dependent Clp protease ATP-binding subunit ClpA